MVDLAKGRHTATRFALGAALGVLVFLAVYGVSPLDVANDAFCRGGYIEKDIQQHYAGWLFYRENAIGFPFCVTKAVNAPAGVSVAYTDSIPLLAALLRPVANALGGTFQYFGWFTLTSFALQGGFGALLCGLFCESVPACAAGSLLFSASPILIERAFRHTSLGAQWLVLAALYCYFCGRRQEVRCDIRTYYAVLATITYDSGDVVYVSALTKLASISDVVNLVESVSLS